jgi:hypothetical protein
MIHKLKTAWENFFHGRSRPPEEMAKKSRVLWVHAGGHKTGSKTIQNYLYLGGLQTTAPNIYYPKMNGVENPKYMNCGNGYSLFPMPCGQDLASKIESFVGSAQEAILSHEELSRLSEEEWRRLDSVASEKGIEVRVVFFVRNVLPFLLSVYDQGIKGGWVATEFVDFAATADWLHATALRNLARVFPPDRLRVRHYDSERQNLLRSFFEAVGVLNPSLAPVAGQIGLLNRSLTREERELFLYVNRTQKHRLFSEALNRGLQEADPNAISEKPMISLDLQDKLQIRFASEVDWINKTFFDGRQIIGLGEEMNRVAGDKSPEEQLEKSLRVHRKALEIVMQKAVTAAEDYQNRLRHRLETLDRDNLADPDLPHDFDPVAYLVLNQDLVWTNFPLVRHFLDYGRREGRAYRF